MSHVVCEPCLDCRYTDCVVVCPVDCFHEGARMLYIDPEVCIDCALCVPECPVEAIFRDVDVPERWAAWIEINEREAPRSPVITERVDPLPGAPPRPQR
jgi:ferredoxin